MVYYVYVRLNSQNNQRLGILALAGIISLAASLALLFLGSKSLWLDEAISVAIARSGWSDLWNILAHGEANMSLYYILLHWWLNFGQNETIIRGLSVVCAVLTVPVAFVLGSRLFNKKVGLAAALLLAVSPFFIEYSQEARSYSLVLLLSTLSTLLFTVVIVRSSKWLWAGYIVISVLAIYSHVYAVFVLAVQVISLLFLPRLSIPWRNLVGSWSAILVLIIPLTVSILTSSPHNIDWAQRPGWRDVYDLFSILTFGKLLTAVLLVPCLVAFSQGVRNWIGFRSAVGTWRYWLLLLWLIVPVVLSFAISQIKPLFAPQYFIIIIPALALLAAAGIFRLPRIWISAALIVILLVLSGRQVYAWYSLYLKEDWRDATSYILSRVKPNDAIVFYSPDTRIPFDYYRQVRASDLRPAEVLYFNPEKYSVSGSIYDIPAGFSQGGRLPEPDPGLTARLADYNRVWLVLSHDQLPNRALGREQQCWTIMYSLLQNYNLNIDKKFAYIRVFLFIPK
jgi:mannosyltransferase